MSNTTKVSTIKELISDDNMFKRFRTFYGMEQEGKNEYEVGCIQAANVFMPIILELLMELESKSIERL